MAPFEAISMTQDDSKWCVHLLSQKNDPSWSDLAPPLKLAAISYDLAATSHKALQTGTARVAETGIPAARKPTSTKPDDLGL